MDPSCDKSGHKNASYSIERILSSNEKFECMPILDLQWRHSPPRRLVYYKDVGAGVIYSILH